MILGYACVSTHDRVSNALSAPVALRPVQSASLYAESVSPYAESVSPCGGGLNWTDWQHGRCMALGRLKGGEEDCSPQVIEKAERAGDELGFLAQDGQKRRGRKPSSRIGQVHTNVVPNIAEKIASKDVQRGDLIEEVWAHYKEKTGISFPRRSSMKMLGFSRGRYVLVHLGVHGKILAAIFRLMGRNACSGVREISEFFGPHAFSVSRLEPMRIANVH